MRLELMSILMVISTLLMTSLNAQTEAERDTLQMQNPTPTKIAPDPIDLEFGEMIFDETMTKVGRDFYDEFYTNWSNPTKIEDFSISIQERPMPGVGTQIRVFIDEHEILTQFIRPNQEQIEILAEYAIGVATQYLLNYQEIQAQLQSDDQSGTGIF